MRVHCLKFVVLAVTLVLLSTSAFAASNLPASYFGRISPRATSATSAPLTVTGKQTIAPTDACSSVSVTITGAVTGTVDDGNGYDNVTFELWDDGVLKDSQVVKVPVGVTQQIAVTLSFLGRYLTGAPGVGVYSYELGLAVDPFYPVDVQGDCPVKCWITPTSAKPGDFVSIQAEVPNSIIPTAVKAFNGDLKIAKLLDPDGNGIWTGTWQVPAGMPVGWKANFSVMVQTSTSTIWCPGFNLTQ